MHPRHRIDISFGDLAFAALACLFAHGRARLEERVTGLFGRSAGADPLVCLSVRSGFDLLLDVLDLEPGSEVMVSAITHPDMVGILKIHGLRAVPIDLDSSTLAPRLDALERAQSERTVAILVAHLFGGRVDLAPISAFADRHGLLVIEDNAQAFRGPHDAGDSRADVSMFSFGMIKTATALGGAILYIRDESLWARMRCRLAPRPVQRRAEFVRRVLVSLALVILSNRYVYDVFVRAIACRGDLDELLQRAVRGVPYDATQPTFLERIRRRPSAPLLALLAHRMRRFDYSGLERRAANGERLATSLPPGLASPGSAALARTHWVAPVVSASPARLVETLRRHGFDAARATTSIAAIPAPEDRPDLTPDTAIALMEQVVFVPVSSGLSDRALRRLIGIVHGVPHTRSTRPQANRTADGLVRP